jgi:hypothetical protein
MCWQPLPTSRTRHFSSRTTNVQLVVVSWMIPLHL